MKLFKPSFRKKTGLMLFVLCLSLSALRAQQKNIPLKSTATPGLELYLNKIDSVENIHTSIRPILESKVNFKSNVIQDSSKRDRNIIVRKLLYESFIIVNKPDFRLTIDPLVEFEYGKDLIDTSAETLFKNTRGLLVKADIGNKFSLESSFYENQARFVDYISDFVNDYGVVPGQGRTKEFKVTAFDFAMASGYISYTPKKWLNVQLGHGKHFVGDGYRSMLLSDNTFNYPYFKVTTSFGKFQYTAIYASLQILGEPVKFSPLSEAYFKRKEATFNLLSWAISKRIEMGFFEGIMWNNLYKGGKTDFNFFNPVLFIRPFQYGLDQSTNVLLGSTIKVKITNTIACYGQLAMDDIKKQKLAYQVGAKYFNVFGLKQTLLQVEYNAANPYTYGQRRPAQSYSHYNQALAHPVGANFKELVVLLNYSVFKKILLEAKFNHIQYGADTLTSHWGKNIFYSDNNGITTSFTGKIGQGVKTKLFYSDLRISYVVNPVRNLNISAGVIGRMLSPKAATADSRYFYIAFKTDLTNFYYDF